MRGWSQSKLGEGRRRRTPAGAPGQSPRLAQPQLPQLGNRTCAPGAQGRCRALPGPTRAHQPNSSFPRVDTARPGAKTDTRGPAPSACVPEAPQCPAASPSRLHTPVEEGEFPRSCRSKAPSAHGPALVRKGHWALEHVPAASLSRGSPPSSSTAMSRHRGTPSPLVHQPNLGKRRLWTVPPGQLALAVSGWGSSRSPKTLSCQHSPPQAGGYTDAHSGYRDSGRSSPEEQSCGAPARTQPSEALEADGALPGPRTPAL